MSSIKTSYYEILDGEAGVGFGEICYLHYVFVHKDHEGIKSKTSQYGIVTGLPVISVNGSGEDPKVVALKYCPCPYSGSIDKMEVYRAKDADGATIAAGTATYYYIGEVEAGDEGIFIDDYIASGKAMSGTDGEEVNYESGLRWSQPYDPSHVKLESFAEYKSGDGDQATGLEVIYGNLVIFKENSIHRVAVQAKNPPISRTDEITDEFGCIAPNSLININNTLYFLSWKGFMVYNNNALQKVDGKFDEELQFVLKHNDIGAIRDSSCGYNAYHNEIYLNVPMLPTDATDGRQYYYGNKGMFDSDVTIDGEAATKWERTLLGHIYVLNLNKGYVTKFAYQTTLTDPSQSNLYINEIANTRQLIRMYYTNSLGELRSGDILPHLYGAMANTPVGSDPDAYNWAGIYIETPYSWPRAKIKLVKTSGTWTAGLQIPSEYGNVILSDMDEILSYENANNVPVTDGFPSTRFVPVRCEYRSKFFTGDTETLIKRLRKVIMNIYSKGKIDVKVNTIERETDDDRITNKSSNLTESVEEFSFNPPYASYDFDNDATLTGTGTNVLEIVPRSPYLANETFYDDYGKPVKVSIDISSFYRTQLDTISYHWRPIHTYLS